MTSTVLFALILWSLWAGWKRPASVRWPLLLSVLWFGFVGSGTLAGVLLFSLQNNPPLLHPDWASRNVIVVLGGGTVKWDGQVRTQTLAVPRLLETQRLYLDCKRRPERRCRILASGGDPMAHGIAEAETIARELVELGVESGDIVRENESRNTFENARFSREMLTHEPLDTGAKLFLVTSGLHMRRASVYFHHFGLPVEAAPADFIAVPFSIFPNSINFLLADAGLHELFDLVRFRGERAWRGD